MTYPPRVAFPPLFTTIRHIYHYYSQPLSSATGAEKNGLQETTVGSTEVLKTTVSEALASVSSASIRGFYRLALRAIDAYSAGVQYGTEEFKQKVYKYIYIPSTGRR